MSIDARRRLIEAGMSEQQAEIVAPLFEADGQRILARLDKLEERLERLSDRLEARFTWAFGLIAGLYVVFALHHFVR